MSERLFLGQTPDEQHYRLKADRLRTHGVVVGMTGSGKTGLCLVLLEELVGAGVPIIAIDPKGDLGNLGLLFPQLSAEEFGAWAPSGEDPAGLSERWKSGLSKWGLSTTDVGALSAKLDMTVYSPGSEAGVPVDLIGCFARPDAKILEDGEATRDLVKDTVSGLLGLVGKNVDPVKDPAHIVLSQILVQAWSAGEDLDLEALILKLVDPPFEKVGVFPVDRFFPADDRMELAVALNGVIASPAFAAWTQGRPLDVDAMLQQGDRSKVSVFSLGHLAESERQFFLSLLLGRVLAWTRAQPGSDGLRGILFFDEVAGYLPPHPKNPGTKGPLLTMMKQARAVGFGVVLATQNPVDLDYKALSNAGLWCVGRLNTSQDRARLLQGLEAEGDLDATVANLEKRQFMIHQVGRGAPQVVSSRHAMCYLRGPLTKVELPKLNALRGVDADAPAPSSTPKTAATRTPAAAVEEEEGSSVPPSVSRVDRWFLDPRVAFSARMDGLFEEHREEARSDGKVLFAPALIAEVELRFDETRMGFELDHREVRVWFPLRDRLDDPTAARIEADDLLNEPVADARYRALPTWLDEGPELTRIKKDLLEDIYRNETRGMFVNKALKLYGKPGETRDAFEARCRDAIEDKADEKIASLRDRFEAKADKIRDKIEAKKLKLVELEGVAKSRQVEEAVNIGATILSFFGGRKKSLGTAVRQRRQSSVAAGRVDRTRAEIEKLEADADELTLELEEKVDEIESDQEKLLEEIEEKEVGLEKNDIRLARFGILWVPVTSRL